MSAKKQELINARQKVAELLDAVGLDMNRTKRELLAILARREAWIQKRIQSMATEGKIHHHDEGEVKALSWAVNHIIVQEAEMKRLREDIKRLRVQLQERGKERNHDLF